MLEIFLFVSLAIALIGSFSAGFWDLKTTNIPDEVILIMSTAGIFMWYVYALTTGNFTYLTTSLLLGTTIFILGWILYARGVWGLGDPALLASMFYLIPDVLFFFDYISTLVVVALAYIIVYSIVAGARSPGVWTYFTKSMKKKIHYLPIIVLIVIFSVLTYYSYPVIGNASLWFAVIPVVAIFAVYAKGVEKIAFRKEILASKVREGDVLLESTRWTGLTKDEAEQIQKQKGKIVVKDGIRLGLAFAIALVLTILFGNIFLLLVGV